MQRCNESPSRQLLKAYGEFNRGDWFECHETLEELWIGEQGELRDFYQGILQVSVALLHWRNGNFRGAISLLDGGAGYLRRVPPVCQRIDVADLIDASDTAREKLNALGRDRMSELPLEQIPKLRLVAVPDI